MSSPTASGVRTLNIRGFPHTQQDTTGACARIDVWDSQTSSNSVSESASAGTHTGSSPDATPALCLPSSSHVTSDDTAKAAQRDLWRTRSPQLQSIYGLWSTCTCRACDVDDDILQITPLPTARWGLDGDIFGVGKRPVQHEIETDGCVRLVFVGVESIAHSNDVWTHYCTD